MRILSRVDIAVGQSTAGGIDQAVKAARIQILQKAHGLDLRLVAKIVQEEVDQEAEVILLKGIQQVIEVGITK